MPRDVGTGRVAVVLKGYPRLSETFIAQELLALQDRGLAFDIWSLRHPYDDRTHPIHGQITAPCHYLPEYLHHEPLRVLRALARAIRLPGFGRAFGTWWRDLLRDRTPNRIRRFGQACVLAAEMDGETDAVYAHFLHTPGSVARYGAMMRGLPGGFSAHAKDIWTIPEWEKREKIASSVFGVTCTGTGAEHLQGLDPDGGKVSLVYHGLDLSRFPAPPTRRTPSPTFRLLSVGRLVAKKGYEDLLAALASLPYGVDWHLTHIGGGPLAETLGADAARRGIADRITWMGKRDQTEVVAAMRDADLFVLPSKIAGDGDRDGLPNVLMEAASQKLPLLSTAISAIPEFITDGVHGRLVDAGDPEALAAAIVALRDAPDDRQRMADAAFARLEADFGMDAGIALLMRKLDAARAPA